MSYMDLSTLMDTVLGTTPGYVATRGASLWTASPVTASAVGSDGDVQFATSGVLNGAAAFNYDAASNTLTTGTFSGNFSGNLTGNVTGYASALAVTSQTVGDLFYASSSTAVTRLADVAAGQPLLSGGTTTAPAYAGYTFSGTGGKTYTFPADSKTLAPTDSPTFSTYVILPNGASPTTDAAGKIAIRTGAGAASGVQYYGNAAPGSILLPGYQVGSPMTIGVPTSTSDFPYYVHPLCVDLKSSSLPCCGWNKLDWATSNL